jgi:hypothetical protein
VRVWWFHSRTILCSGLLTRGAWSLCKWLPLLKALSPSFSRVRCLKTKATRSFETPETACTATKCHMPNDKNPQICGFRAILSHCHISYTGYVSFRRLSPFTVCLLTCIKAALPTERAWLSLTATLIFIFFSWDFWLLIPVGNLLQSGSIQPVETRLCRTIQLGEVALEDQDEHFWTALVSKFVNTDVRNFRTFVITRFIPLSRA